MKCLSSQLKYTKIKKTDNIWHNTKLQTSWCSSKHWHQYMSSFSLSLPLESVTSATYPVSPAATLNWISYWQVHILPNLRRSRWLQVIIKLSTTDNGNGWCVKFKIMLTPPKSLQAQAKTETIQGIINCWHRPFWWNADFMVAVLHYNAGSANSVADALLSYCD